jgi:RHS repeat-associated protein
VKLDYTGGGNAISGLDRFGRVVDQIWERYGANPALLDEYVYEYDRAGNRTRKYNALNSDLNETYEYNALDELTSTVRNNGFDQSWTLDGLGNFSEFDDNGSSQTRDTNAANEITSTTGIATPTYDLAGNMISDGTQDYYYDAWNRQTSCIFNAMWGMTYLYDGLGRRIMKVATESMVKQHYYYNNNWQLLESRVVENMGNEIATVDQYVWSQRYIDSPIVCFHEDVYYPQYNNTRYYTTDANHNVTATIDAATGSIVNRYAYTAYGKATVYSPTWTDPADPGTDGPLYCGYFFDAETGNYLARNRYYSVTIAAWFTRDPIGFKGGINLYEYCADRPLMYIDPSGLDGIPGLGMYWPQDPPVKQPTKQPECCPPTKKECDAEKGQILYTAIKQIAFAHDGKNNTMVEYEQAFPTLTTIFGLTQSPLFKQKPCWFQKALLDFENNWYYGMKGFIVMGGTFADINLGINPWGFDKGGGDIWAIEEAIRTLDFLGEVEKICKDAK